MKISKKNIVEILEVLGSTYGEIEKRLKEDKEKLKKTIDIWYECLKDLDYEDVNKAVFELIKTSRYIPTIADIRGQTGEIQGRGQKEKTIGVDTSNLTNEEYGALMRKEVTIEELIEKGRVNVL